MRKLLYAAGALAALGGIAFAQSVGWPPPAGMLAALGVYNSSAPTLTTGQISPLQLDAAGNLKTVASGTPSGNQTVQVDGAEISTTSTAALAANQIIKSSAGQLYSFNVSADSTLSAAAWWIMIYNATTAPADGAITPAKCYAMTLGTTSYSAAFPSPVPFATGITIGVSTTGCFTKTASTHAFISGDFK